ncbi:hypothetical protein [Taibaiella koreensis]|uniref:hypothetical protein n=1 Tax=Taibaiella koreensis TaxID=1268548 RepID=UPI000E59EDAF|nr:hypothetical protein [Taibaiella koreensis]
MEDINLIPMEEDYKDQLRLAYLRPLRKGVGLLSAFTFLIAFMGVYIAIHRSAYHILFFLLPLGFAYLYILNKLRQVKLHYYKDYRLGYIVKEQVKITKVFDTPSGINIYWLSSEDIKSFVPDPYRIFREGDRVFVYYLKHAKEYLAYEL